MGSDPRTSAPCQLAASRPNHRAPTTDPGRIVAKQSIKTHAPFRQIKLADRERSPLSLQCPATLSDGMAGIEVADRRRPALALYSLRRSVEFGARWNGADATDL